jgi:hypothetical protein
MWGCEWKVLEWSDESKEMRGVDDDVGVDVI